MQHFVCNNVRIVGGFCKNLICKEYANIKITKINRIRLACKQGTGIAAESLNKLNERPVLFKNKITAIFASPYFSVIVLYRESIFKVFNISSISS